MDKDKDIHNEIDEEIEGIVYDDNDTDAETELTPEDTKQDKEPERDTEENASAEEAVSDESVSEEETDSEENESDEKLNPKKTYLRKKLNPGKMMRTGKAAEPKRKPDTRVSWASPEHKRARAAHKKINKRFVIIAAGDRAGCRGTDSHLFCV